MKKLLKNQTGSAILVVILVLALAVVGGGATFLTVRMLVAGDGNFLQPFEELGWIESSDEDEDDAKETKKSTKDDVDDDDEEDDEDKDNKKDETKKTSGDKTKFLVQEDRLSPASKKSSVKHYHGDISLAETMEADDEEDEFADLYKLLKAEVNLYAQDDKVIEIEFGFDISEFCEEAFKQYKDEFTEMGVKDSSGLEEMMMEMIESEFDEFDDEKDAEYVKKYVEGGSLQLYVTEEGFKSLYETYDIENEDNSVDTLISALEEAFNTKISLVK